MTLPNTKELRERRAKCRDIEDIPLDKLQEYSSAKIELMPRRAFAFDLEITLNEFRSMLEAFNALNPLCDEVERLREQLALYESRDLASHLLDATKYAMNRGTDD